MRRLAAWMQKHVILSVVLGSIIGMLLPVVVYLVFFSNQKFEADLEKWSFFGTYFGSFATPILTFATLLFLAYSYVVENKRRHQEEEKARERENLQREDQRKEQNLQVFLNLAKDLEPKFDEIDISHGMDFQHNTDYQNRRMRFEYLLSQSMPIFMKLEELSPDGIYGQYFSVKFEKQLMAILDTITPSSPIYKYFISKYPTMHPIVVLILNKNKIYE